MRDLVSKLTFGFLMAQLVPGALAVASFAFLAIAFGGDAPNSVKGIILYAVEHWPSSPVANVVLAFSCVVVGMLIHGVHWAILAYLETYDCTNTNGGVTEAKRRPIHEVLWHKHRRPVLFHVVLGPIRMIRETVCFLFTCSRGKNLATHENVPRIPKDRMEAFQFVQDFYLHFSQFYAHTAYSLLMATVSIVVFSFFFEFTLYRVGLIIFLYLLTGLFFVVGRIQLLTLFIAERDLLPKDNEPKSEMGPGDDR